MVIQNGFESAGGMLIELVWLIYVDYFVIGKISNLLIGVLGAGIGNHVEYDIDLLWEEISFLILR